MSKRDNKRFNDKDRKSAPKRGGKNRRDYGDEYTYEPKKRTSSAGPRRQGGSGARAADQAPGLRARQGEKCPARKRAECSALT